MDFKIKCFVCHNEVSSLGVASHVKKHKISIVEFKKQYIKGLISSGVSEQIKFEYLQLTTLFELSKKYCIPVSYLKDLFIFLNISLKSVILQQVIKSGSVFKASRDLKITQKLVEDVVIKALKESLC